MRTYRPKGKRQIRIVGELAFVPLTQGYEAVIDAADAPLVAGRNWRAQVDKRAGERVYVHARANGQTLQAAILGEREGQIITHIDGDGLNNRRANLQFRAQSLPWREIEAEDNAEAIPADRQITIEGSIARVPLTQGRVAIIDAEDAPLLAGHAWRLLTRSRPFASYVGSGKERLDAVRTEKVGRRSRIVFMSHVIAKQLDWWQEGMKLTFKNGDRLDLRRVNLKPFGADHNTNTGLPGITRHEWRHKPTDFSVRVVINRRSELLGYYPSLEEAVAAYNDARARFAPRHAA